MSTLLIQNAHIINYNEEFISDVLVEDGIITKIAKNIPLCCDEESIEASNFLVFPAGIDPHVHMQLPTPAGASCDDFANGSKAAFAGGTTNFMDFVTPSKGQSLIEALSLRLKETESSLVDFSLHLGITWFAPSVLEEMKYCVQKLGVKSFKVYLAYKGSIGLELSELKQVMQTAASLSALVLVHCEEGDEIIRLQQAFIKEGKIDVRYHALSRPPETESESVKKVIALVRETNCKTYFVHISTAKSTEYIRQAKKEGLPIFCETCPQYLLLDDSVYEKPITESLKYVLSPPLRKVEDQTALWKTLKDGTIDTIATDHCPFNTFGQKDKGLNNFTRIPNGAGGIEFRLQLLYTYGVLENKIALQDFVRLTSTNAAKIFGLFPQKGTITVGSDADIIIWDPKASAIISADNQIQHCDSNIYEGFEIKGSVHKLIKKGVVVFG